MDRLSSAEIFDPGTGEWTYTGSLSVARSAHTAVLLAGGQILVAGGSSSEPTGYTPTTELYDTATGLWALSGELDGARGDHSVTLLPSGQVLVAGGSGPGTPKLGSAELFEIGLGFQPAWRPAMQTVSLSPDGRFTIQGSGFRGFGLAEASSGTTSTSATNYPLVQLQRLDNYEQRWLRPDPELPFSESAYASLPATGYPCGPTLVTLFVNGIASESRVVQIGKVRHALYLPLLMRQFAQGPD
jgi:hypothetical protein